MTKVGWYAVDTSMILESNKSPCRLRRCWPTRCGTSGAMRTPPLSDDCTRSATRTSTSRAETLMLEAAWLESRAWVAAMALLGLCGLLVGGCASTAIQAQWADPLFAGRSLRGATVLVVCNAHAPAIQRIC